MLTQSIIRRTCQKSLWPIMGWDLTANFYSFIFKTFYIRYSFVYNNLKLNAVIESQNETYHFFGLTILFFFFFWCIHFLLKQLLRAKHASHHTHSHLHEEDKQRKEQPIEITGKSEYKKQDLRQRKKTTQTAGKYSFKMF